MQVLSEGLCQAVQEMLSQASQEKHVQKEFSRDKR